MQRSSDWFDWTNVGRRGGIAAALLLALSVPGEAFGQSVIKRPGAHPRYDVEVEPHFVFQWANRFAGDGFGPGVRVNIPLFHNGPIKTLNNSMAIGPGFDLTFGDDNCRWWWDRQPRDEWLRSRNCGVTELWFPVVLQWNFYVTRSISVFGEPGFAIAHRRWSWEWWCDNRGGPICQYSGTDTDFAPVFWAGARFMFSDAIGATVRVGVPYISAGINFLL